MFPMMHTGAVLREGALARDHRRLAAIVSADVVGYSLLMGRDDSATLAGLKAHRRELIDPKIAEYGGRIVKTTGDGLLLEFPSVVDAVRCAVDVQRGMAERNAGVPDRCSGSSSAIGINVGDIIIDGEDIFGDGVNVAARLQTLADPGGICVSKVVRDQVLDKLSFTFEDLGAQAVKNIARPVDVYRVALDGGPTPRGRPAKLRSRRVRWAAAGTVLLVLTVVGAASVWWTSHRESASQPFAMSVAVLPIAARGGSPADERLAELLTDNVTTVLSRDRWTQVVARGRVVGARGEPADPRRLERGPGARYVAMGEMHREGGNVAVLMHLVDTETDADVWSDRFEFDAVRAESEPVRFAERIERRLWNGVFESAKAYAVSHSMTGDPWNAYLRASANWQRTEDHSAARKQLGEVLRLDPDFVPALASVAEAIIAQLSDASGPNEAQVRKDLEEADQKTSRAVALGSGDSYAWRMRAIVLTWMGRWDEALAASARAEEVDPGSFRRVLDRADILLLMGRPEEALTLAQYALAMDPETIDAVDMSYISSIRCRCDLALGRYREAMPACERLGASGSDWRSQARLAAVYAQLGEVTKATAARTAALKLEPRLTIAYLKAMPRPGSQAYLDLLDTHYYAGLRKAGFAEQCQGKGPQTRPFP